MRRMIGLLGIKMGIMEMRRIRVRMIEIRGIRVGMWGIGVGMRGIRVIMRGIGDGNKGNHGENLRIGLEMMNKKCGEG